jgi:hypothetical protein
MDSWSARTARLACGFCRHRVVPRLLLVATLSLVGCPGESQEVPAPDALAAEEAEAEAKAAAAERLAQAKEQELQRASAEALEHLKRGDLPAAQTALAAHPEEYGPEADHLAMCLDNIAKERFGVGPDSINRWPFNADLSKHEELKRAIDDAVSVASDDARWKLCDAQGVEGRMAYLGMGANHVPGRHLPPIRHERDARLALAKGLGSDGSEQGLAEAAFVVRAMERGEGEVVVSDAGDRRVRRMVEELEHRLVSWFGAKLVAVEGDPSAPGPHQLGLAIEVSPTGSFYKGSKGRTVEGEDWTVAVALGSWSKAVKVRSPLHLTFDADESPRRALHGKLSLLTSAYLGLFRVLRKSR